MCLRSKRLQQQLVLFTVHHTKKNTKPNEHTVKELACYMSFKKVQQAAESVLALTKKISGDSARLKVCNAFIWPVASHCATDLCGKMKYDCLMRLVFHCLQMLS